MRAERQILQRFGYGVGVHTPPLWEAAEARFQWLYGTYVRDLRSENKKLRARLSEMENKLNIETNTEERHIPWAPELITGGGGGDDNNVEPLNWLKELPVGTYFMARERKTDPRNPMLSEFKVEWHGERVTKLKQITGSGEEMEFPVETIRFSRHMEKIEVE